MSASSLTIIMSLVSAAPELIKTFTKLLQDPAIQNAEHLLEAFFNHNDPQQPNNPALAGQQ